MSESDDARPLVRADLHQAIEAAERALDEARARHLQRMKTRDQAGQFIPNGFAQLYSAIAWSI